MIDLLTELEKEGRLNSLIQAGVISYKARLYLDIHQYYHSLAHTDLKKVEKVAKTASKYKVSTRTVYVVLQNPLQ